MFLPKKALFFNFRRVSGFELDKRSVIRYTIENFIKRFILTESRDRT